MVLALDVARAAKDPKTLSAFAKVMFWSYHPPSSLTYPRLQWSNQVSQSCPTSLKSQIAPELHILQQAVEEFLTSYKAPVAPIVPRPAAMVLGIVTSSIHLLEHAIWSHKTSEPSKELDIEVFKRWIVDAGTEGAIKALKEAKKGSQDVIAKNSALVFGDHSGTQMAGAKHKL